MHPKQFLSLWYVWRKPCTYLAPTLTYLQTDRNKVQHDPRHLGVPSGASNTMSETMVRSAQTVHLSCIMISTLQTDRNELPLEPRHLVVPSSASKTISEPMVCLPQTMHLYCTDTNSVSKHKEARFQMTHITYLFHRVRPK